MKDLEFSMQKLDIQEGDTFVFTVKGYPDAKQMKQFSDEIQRIAKQGQIPKNCTFIVVNESVTVEKLQEYISRKQDKDGHISGE